MTERDRLKVSPEMLDYLRGSANRVDSGTAVTIEVLTQERPGEGKEKTCPNGYTLAHHIDGVLAIARTSEMTPTECGVVEHRLRQLVKFFAEPEQPASEGEDCEFCNGDGIIRGEAPGGKVVEVAYCPNQCKSSSTEEG